jgi:hypothetical protein
MPAFHVTESDPGLQLMRMEFDPRRRRTCFRLWPSREPGARPFDVFAELASSDAGTPARTAGARPAAPLLVRPRQPAELVYEGRQFRAATRVSALEGGVLGQRIRVRQPATRAVIRAQVIGPQRVRVAP